MTPEIADLLAIHRPFSIEITLYGATRRTYERVTGNPGSFGQCLRGIRYLRDRGLPLKLKATVSALNRHEIQAMKRLAEDDLGLPFRFDALLNARCDGSPGPLDVRLGAGGGGSARSGRSGAGRGPAGFRTQAQRACRRQ